MAVTVTYIQLAHDTRHFLTGCRRDQLLMNPVNGSWVVSTVMGIFVSHIPCPPTTKAPELYEPERLMFKKCVSSY
jgi:hypothetical protein